MIVASIGETTRSRSTPSSSMESYFAFELGGSSSEDETRLSPQRNREVEPTEVSVASSIYDIASCNFQSDVTFSDASRTNLPVCKQKYITANKVFTMSILPLMEAKRNGIRWLHQQFDNGYQREIVRWN